MKGMIRSTRVTLSGQPIRRNAPCPCGSGKKFKACHLVEKRQRDAELLEEDRYERTDD